MIPPPRTLALQVLHTPSTDAFIPEGAANRPLRVRDRTEISALVLADPLAVGSAPVLSLEEGAECRGTQRIGEGRARRPGPPAA